jgi:hypothetical protein
MLGAAFYKIPSGKTPVKLRNIGTEKLPELIDTCKYKRRKENGKTKNEN